MSFTEPLTLRNYNKTRRGARYGRRRVALASYRDRLKELYTGRSYTQEKIKDILNEEFHLNLTLGKLKKDLAALKLRRNREYNLAVEPQKVEHVQHSAIKNQWEFNEQVNEQVENASFSHGTYVSKPELSKHKTSTVDGSILDITPEVQERLPSIVYESLSRSSRQQNTDDDTQQQVEDEVLWNEFLDYMQGEDSFESISAGISPMMELKEMEGEWEQQERGKSLNGADLV